MKKRYIIYLSLLAMIVLGFWVYPPVLPVIQLPGEPVIPNIPILGAITNTFIATLITYAIVIVLAWRVNARSRTADEVPTGFYNLIEMIIEGAYNFVEGVAGGWSRKFFPFFMTFILLILIANWLELVPGVDSIGKWENLPHFRAEQAVQAAENALEAGESPLDVLTNAPLSAEVRQEIAQDFALEPETVLPEAEQAEFLHAIEEEVEHAVDEENVGDLRQGALLVRAEEGEDEEKPADADWTIVPFVRVPATDLNFTLALAVISVVMTQYYGLRALGLGYLKKFFIWEGDKIARNPLGLMDTGVGLIEFISEIAKILSFSFRLFGNIFAGQVLLFVIGFLAPVALVAVYGLEFFVGIIQAMVFGLLTLTFMAGATASHHDEEEHH
jgi:F-type H+-transporting ATPase subunit a